jgi:hypothetical protein
MEINDADIVLRSSDFVNFRVHKSILASSSQFFKDMFSLPQPSNDEMVDGLPVVSLSEDGEIVRGLITMLYPISPEVPESYERVLALLGAAKKYDMPAVLYSIRAGVAYKDLPEPAGAHALRAYAIAFSNGLSDEARTAARLTLDYPLTFEALGDDLRLFGGSALRSLSKYRKRCRDSVVSCLKSFLDVHNGSSKIWVGCPTIKAQHMQYKRSRRSVAGTSTLGSTRNSDDEFNLPSWLRDLFTQQIKKSKQDVNNSLIKPSSIREKYLAALMKHSDHNDCTTCLRVHAYDGEKYCAELEEKLTSARNQHDVWIRLSNAGLLVTKRVAYRYRLSSETR